MAIQFARIEIVGRSSGGSACLKAAYNARMIIKDEQTNITYNFARKGDNVYHAVLLPGDVDPKFKDPRVLMNEVERTEKRKNSQLLKDIVIALPDDKELDLQDRIAITHEIIEEMAWVKNSLGVQVDIHSPHDGEKNWHAHLLITTRRFKDDGTGLGLKAVDLNPEFKKSAGKSFIIPESQMMHERVKEVINRYFAKLGLETRVDPISTVSQQHIGPVRMRSSINEIAEQNEVCKLAHLEIIKNGDGVLNRIIRHQAIFTKRDLEKAVKEIQDLEEKQKLVQEVLDSDRLVKLYNEDGKSTKYYTTIDVREEESRLLRIATRVNEQIIDSNTANLAKEIESLTNVSATQREALRHILLQSQGIRILRGRAGTGKSHIIAEAYRIVTSSGGNIVGLAPTHKAVSELRSKGYQECYTVKGFLFKLYNGKTNLPQNSLIVVDEAGMVGTRDYLELLKVAENSNCNVILAGDERQLTSVERGGMFEVFANKFGSYVLSDIKRQSQGWSQEMALRFAEYDIAGGLQLLDQHNGLKIDHSLAESMSQLIDDWSKSKFELQERLIITVRNKEVDSINKDIRGLLKANGTLTGKEYRRFVSGTKSGQQYEDYMVGDRILFKASNKDLKIENGEFASLVTVSKDKFVAKTDSGREIEFNPQHISFKHGYASTVYKAQGASIKDVYVLHNLAGNSRNSYVAMTRHVEQVKLYYNRQATRNIKNLIYQLSKIDHSMASTGFLTQEDLTKIKEKKSPTIIDKIGHWFKSMANNISDKLHSNKEYYHPTIKSEPLARVAAVLEQTATNLKDKDLTTNIESTAKIMTSHPIKNNYGSHNKQEMAELKQRLSLQAGEIAINLLGKPNKRLSNSYILRWGEDGKIAMKIKGNKAGIWYDFSKGEGGDLLTLMQRERNYDFSQAKKYLQEIVAMPNSSKDKDWRQNPVINKVTQHAKAQDQQNNNELAKIKRAQDLYNKSNSVLYSAEDNVARKYLSKTRGIESVLTKFKLSSDLRTKMMWDDNTKQSYPALIAFARDKGGNVTGGQSIYLNKETGSKANIDVNKRSFGKISGSFVTIQQEDEGKNNVTIIAEGVETALSLQETAIKGKILCSLGISNVKNYQPTTGEKIIIAADNDGQNALSIDAVVKAKEELTNKGAIVSVVMPPEKGDFNDMLKTQEAESVRKVVEPEIVKLTTELGFLKQEDNNRLHEFQQQIKLLKRFATQENISAALQIYKEKDMTAFIAYSNKICSTAIEQKITADLQIMKNKFDPKHDFGNVKFGNITVDDFNGRKHLVPEDYLSAIGRDEQVMQYINPGSIIGKVIQIESKNTVQTSKTQAIQVKL